MRYFNRYAYAFNNPYSFTDPDGRCNQFINGIVGGLPCHLQQRNLNPAHVAADEATARDARMLVETQFNIALTVGPFGAGKALELGAVLQNKTAKFVYCAVLECSAQLSTIARPSAALRDAPDQIATHLAKKAETTARSTERLRRDSPGIRPPANRDGKLGDGKLDSGGFQGVFRVEGRIDSRRLDKELSGK